jgi:hypothetical protein
VTLEFISQFTFVMAMVSIAVPGVVVAVRALPPVERLVMRGVKPWACDICSCFWVTAIFVGGIALRAALREGWDGDWPSVLPVAAPSYTLSLLILRLVQAPQSGGFPPDLPEA